MKEGEMYVYTDPKVTLEQKIDLATEAYRKKRGHAPDTCFINATQNAEALGESGCFSVNGVVVKGLRNILPDYFWIGVEGAGEQEIKREPDDPIYLATRAREVTDFLQERPHLIGVLTEAVPHLRAHFGPEVEVVLAVEHDPEIEGMVDLVASIKVECDPDEALGLMDDFEREWWLGQLHRAEGLIFTLEFGG